MPNLHNLASLAPCSGSASRHPGREKKENLANNSSETYSAFFWDYSVYSYFGIGTTEYTEYQFPIEQIARYSENRIADVIKRDPRERASRQNTIPSILLSGAEWTE